MFYASIPSHLILEEKQTIVLVKQELKKDKIKRAIMLVQDFNEAPAGRPRVQLNMPQKRMFVFLTDI